MPKYTQPKKTWFYPVDFKIKALQLSLREDTLSKDVAQTLDIHPLILSRWRKNIAKISFQKNRATAAIMNSWLSLKLTRFSGRLLITMMSLKWLNITKPVNCPLVGS